MKINHSPVKKKKKKKKKVWKTTEQQWAMLHNKVEKVAQYIVLL